MPIVYERDTEFDNMLISTVVEPFDPSVDTQVAFGQLTYYWGQKDSPLRNNRVEIAQVAEGEIFQLIADWFKQEQYGKLEMPLFQTVEEAKTFLARRMEQPSAEV